MAEKNGSSTRSLAALTATLCVASIACGKPADGKATAFDSGATARPDSNPVMLNKDMPFRYPPALYAEKVQGNVTLRLYVDTAGAVVDDSTRVVESSTVPLLDSAAIKGSRELKFVPAKLHGTPVPVSILFPVYFRHPEAPPPAADTMLKKVAVPGADSAAAASSAKADSAAKPKKDTAATKHAEKKSSSTKKKTTRRHRSD
jgi:TonB family protein